MLFFRIHKFKIKFLVFTLNFSEQHTLTHTPTQAFYGPFSGTTRVSRCQKRTSGLGAREV